MTKEHLAERMRNTAHLASKAEAERCLNAILDAIQEALAAGETVSLRDFGSFSVVERAARPGRHPATGEPLTIPAHRTVRFRGGKAMTSTAATVREEEAAEWIGFKEFTREVENQLKGVKTGLDRLRQRATTEGAGQEALHRLGELYDDTRGKFKELTSSGGAAWKELRQGMENAYTQLREAFQRAAEKF